MSTRRADLFGWLALPLVVVGVVSLWIVCKATELPEDCCARARKAGL